MLHGDFLIEGKSTEQANLVEKEYVCPSSGIVVKIREVPSGTKQVRCRFCGKSHQLKNVRVEYYYENEFTYRSERDSVQK